MSRNGAEQARRKKKGGRDREREGERGGGGGLGKQASNKFPGLCIASSNLIQHHSFQTNLFTMGHEFLAKHSVEGLGKHKKIVCFIGL